MKTNEGKVLVILILVLVVLGLAAGGLWSWNKYHKEKSKTLTTTYNWTKYKGEDVSFDYPTGWKVDSSKTPIIVSSADQKRSLNIEVVAVNKSLYSGETATAYQAEVDKLADKSQLENVVTSMADRNITSAKSDKSQVYFVMTRDKLIKVTAKNFMGLRNPVVQYVIDHVI